MTGREVHVDVTQQLIATTLTQITNNLVLAMRAEGISDEVAARVCNRIATGVPDPDAVITPDQPADPTIGTVPVAAYDQLRDDIQRAAGRHVGD